MPDSPSETEVEHEVRVEARPETLFAYFTDPSRIVQWMGNDATLDPRAGGICRIDINGAVMLGRFVEVNPYRRIVVTWGWEQQLWSVPAQSTEVEITLTPDGDDTIVRLTHRRLPSAVAATFHQVGWEHYLQRLAIAATAGAPGPDPWQDPNVFMAEVRERLAREDAEPTT
jgi:uncharacterized protein YndB with AHSA1/START domain